MTKISAILFDMDGTLYDCPELLEKQRDVAVAVLRDFFQWEEIQTQDVYHKTEMRLQGELGCKPTTSGVVVEAGVPLMTYIYECGRRYDGSVFVKRDQTLVRLLKQLRKQVQLLVVTNNNRTQTDLILHKLGVYDLFHHIYSLYETRIIKPDVKLYQEIINECGLAADECLVVGDRYEIDLAPAKQLGMHTRLVKNMQDVYDIEEFIHSLNHS